MVVQRVGYFRLFRFVGTDHSDRLFSHSQQNPVEPATFVGAYRKTAATKDARITTQLLREHRSRVLHAVDPDLRSRTAVTRTSGTG